MVLLCLSVRYGEFHPAFYMGPLKDAIDEAAGQEVTQVCVCFMNSIITLRTVITVTRRTF